jgi:hypothetical protein
MVGWNGRKPARREQNPGGGGSLPHVPGLSEVAPVLAANRAGSAALSDEGRPRPHPAGADFSEKKPFRKKIAKRIRHAAGCRVCFRCRGKVSRDANKTTGSLQRLFPPPKTHTSIAATGPVVSPTTGPFLFSRPSGHPWPRQPCPTSGRKKPALQTLYQLCGRRPHIRASVASALRRREVGQASACHQPARLPGEHPPIQQRYPSSRRSSSVSISAVRVSIDVVFRLAPGWPRISRSRSSRRPPDWAS